MEILETKENLDSIGGLNVEGWLLKRQSALSQRAIEYGLPTPKGLLILGLVGQLGQAHQHRGESVEAQRTIAQVRRQRLYSGARKGRLVPAGLLYWKLR